MNPNSGEKSAARFGAPEKEQRGLEKQREQSMERQNDGESAVYKQAPKAVNSAVLPLPTDLPDAGPVNLPSGQDQPDSTAPSAPHADAKDVHQIEKHWVERAKTVIKQTKDDPKSQKDEMSRVKAEYIQKRFNKTIPTEGKASS